MHHRRGTADNELREWGEGRGWSGCQRPGEGEGVAEEGWEVGGAAAGEVAGGRVLALLSLTNYSVIAQRPIVAFPR